MCEYKSTVLLLPHLPHFCLSAVSLTAPSFSLLLLHQSFWLFNRLLCCPSRWRLFLGQRARVGGLDLWISPPPPPPPPLPLQTQIGPCGQSVCGAERHAPLFEQAFRSSEVAHSTSLLNCSRVCVSLSLVLYASSPATSHPDSNCTCMCETLSCTVVPWHDCFMDLCVSLTFTLLWIAKMISQLMNLSV